MAPSILMVTERQLELLHIIYDGWQQKRLYSQRELVAQMNRDREAVALHLDQPRSVQRNDYESEDRKQQRKPGQQPVAEPCLHAGEVPL